LCCDGKYSKDYTETQQDAWNEIYNENSCKTSKNFWEELIAYFFDTTQIAYKMAPPIIPRCCKNVFTKPLPSNGKGLYRHIHRLSFDTVRAA
jgi:hypothetical protein